MKKRTICLVLVPSLLLLSCNSLSAQKSWEFGVTGGAAVYQGETMPSYFSVETFENINPQGGLLVRYNLNSQLSIEANAHYATLSGDDKKADTEERRRRNLSFKTDIITVGLQLDYNLFGFQPYQLEQPFSPYVFLGIEGFHFNPKAQYNGTWYELQPLGTEGQGSPGRSAKYSLNQLAIPMGVGLRYALTDQWCIGLQGGIRKTFTDYIDDVGGTYVRRNTLAATNGELAAALSNRTGEIGTFVDYATGTQRGGRNDEDWYTFAGITVSYLIYDNQRMGDMRRGRTNKRGCPAWKRSKKLF